MGFPRALFFAAAFFLLVFGNAEAQPSFNCKGQLSPAETKICSDEQLGELDLKLASVFQNRLAHETTDGRRVLIAAQQRWLVERDVDCGFGYRSTDFRLLAPDTDPVQCLKDKYDNRLRDIESLTISPGIEEFGFSRSKVLYTPEILSSTNDAVCNGLLSGVKDDFFSIHRNNLNAPDRPIFPVSGGKWLTLPSQNTTAVLAVDLDSKGQRSALVYVSKPFFSGSGEHRWITFFVQPIADTYKLPTVLAEFEKNPWKPDPNRGLVGVGLFATPGVAWDSYNPIHILEFEHKYYFLSYFPDSTDIIGVSQLHGDGSATMTCQIQVVPRLQAPGLPPGNDPGWRHDWLQDSKHTDASIDIPYDLAIFLGTIRRIQGDEGPMSGTGHFLARLIGASGVSVEQGLVQPWNMVSDQKSLARGGTVARTETSIDEWGRAALSNHHLSSRYHDSKAAAYVAMSNIYHDRFGLPKELSEKYSKEILDKIVVSAFVFNNYVTEINKSNDLGEKLLDGAPLLEIKTYLETSSNPKKLNDYSAYGEPIWFLSIEHPDVLDLMIKNGADIRAGNYFGKTALMYAAQFNLMESVRVLLKGGADVNAATGLPKNEPDFSLNVNAAAVNVRCYHRTALMYAAENASAAAIDELLNAGANPKDTDTCNRAALDYLAGNVVLSTSEKEALTKRLAR